MQLLLRQAVGKFAQVVKSEALDRLESFAGLESKTHIDAADGGDISIRPRLNAVIAAAGRLVGGGSSNAAEKVERNSKAEFKRLGIELRKEEPKFGKLIDGWRGDNVDRAKSLLEFERDKLSEILAKGEHKTVETLRRQIETRLDVVRSKADLLARDQVLKLNANITKERQTAAGITEYVWTTSNDERVREAHAELDGETFSWDDPPVTNDAGDRNHPGEDYQCRCIAFPVLPELGEDSGDDETEAAEGYLAEIPDPEEAEQYQLELSSKAIPDEVEDAGGAKQFERLLRGIEESSLTFLRTGYREPLNVLEGLSATEATALTTGKVIPKGSRRPLPPIKVAIYPDDQLVLVDGRHRMRAAQKAGATKIRSTIIQYDDELNVLWEGDRIIKTPKKTDGQRAHVRDR
jgi:SPP1 gp7 family putative phage head morphogenesis protein